MLLFHFSLRYHLPPSSNQEDPLFGHHTVRLQCALGLKIDTMPEAVPLLIAELDNTSGYQLLPLSNQEDPPLRYHTIQLQCAPGLKIDTMLERVPLLMGEQRTGEGYHTARLQLVVGSIIDTKTITAEDLPDFKMTPRSHPPY